MPELPDDTIDAIATPSLLAARFAALRAQGIDCSAPLRFTYLEALSRRAARQPPAIQHPLQAKILAEMETLAKQAPPAACPPPVSETPSASPLAELLAYIAAHASSNHAADTPTTASPTALRPGAAPELKSVAYFRDTWSKLSTEQQLTQTLAQAPENAGPMNSQHLVLQALQQMRQLSPDYLQAFMSYVDTLIWLEQMAPVKPDSGRSPTGKSDKKTRAGKTGQSKKT